MNTHTRWLLVTIAVLFICFQFYMFPTSPPKHDLQPTISNPKIMIDSVVTELGPKSYNELNEAIFSPMGYTLRENLVVPALDYTQQPICEKVFSDWLIRSKSQNESGTPPKLIPQHLKLNYTLGGHVKLIETYSDERSGIRSKTWIREDIDKYVEQDETKAEQYSGAVWPLFYAFMDYRIDGMKGLIVGSLSPYAEGYALKAGAKHVTTVEYTKINIVDDYRVDYKHPIDIATEAQKHIGAYDFVASFSSIEHSGLGRYGDALDPIGDLREAQKVYCMLKENGLFFIGMPMGWDTLHWNLHRIYGRIRFAMFAAGFDILGVYYKNVQRNVPMSLELFPTPKWAGAHIQPVVVLRKRDIAV